MELLEKLKAWVVTFPLWGEAAPNVDTVGAAPENCGLFPLGAEELSRRADVLGNVTARYRWQFLLRRVALQQEDAARWLLEFQHWAQKHSQQDWGSVRAEKGKLVSAAQTGTGVYEVKLTVEAERYLPADEGEVEE